MKHFRKRLLEITYIGSILLRCIQIYHRAVLGMKVASSPANLMDCPVTASRLVCFHITKIRFNEWVIKKKRTFNLIQILF